MKEIAPAAVMAVKTPASTQTFRLLMSVFVAVVRIIASSVARRSKGPGAFGGIGGEPSPNGSGSPGGTANTGRVFHERLAHRVGHYVLPVGVVCHGMRSRDARSLPVHVDDRVKCFAYVR